MVDKKSLSERNICSIYITLSIARAGWNLHSQIQEEFTFTKAVVESDLES